MIGVNESELTFVQVLTNSSIDEVVKTSNKIGFSMVMSWAYKVVGIDVVN